MKVGDTVKWESQSHGITKEKQGNIVMVVPAGEHFLGKAKFQFEIRKTHKLQKEYGFSRNHESYLVGVPGKTEKSKHVLYWPNVSKLKLVQAM